MRVLTTCVFVSLGALSSCDSMAQHVIAAVLDQALKGVCVCSEDAMSLPVAGSVCKSIRPAPSCLSSTWSRERIAASSAAFVLVQC